MCDCNYSNDIFHPEKPNTPEIIDDVKSHFTAKMITSHTTLLSTVPEKWPDSLPDAVLKAAREAVAKEETSSVATMLRATALGSPQRLNSEMMNEDDDDAGITKSHSSRYHLQ